MSVILVGLSHRTAPVEIRERFVFSHRALPEGLKRILQSEVVLEAALLSTCNRTEIYIRVDDEEEEGLKVALKVLSEQAGPLPEPLEYYLYMHRDLEAVRHLYRVVSGLDSLVLGEVEIQGQVKQAYEAAASLVGPRSSIGRVFHRLFQGALSVGGRVRAETRLSEGAASVPSAGVELARKIFGTLEGRRGMVIGAGEMGGLTLRCLLDEGMESVMLASRDVDRANGLADELGGTAVAYQDLWERLPEIDVLISATAAPHPVIRLDRFRQALPDAVRSPIFIVDIAIPRDVEPEIGELRNVFLYTLDDLEEIVEANFERRKGEIPRADAIVDRAVEEFSRWYSGLQAVPLIRKLRERGEHLRQRELDRSLSRLGHLSDQDIDAIDRLTRDLMNKLLHTPTARLRAAAEDGADREILEAARYLFEMEEEGDGGGSEEE